MLSATLTEFPPGRYNFKSDPRDVGAVVILSADENSYEGELFPFSDERNFVC